MNDKSGPDWHPPDASVLRDQPAAYDGMRRRCPVARSEQLGWSLFRHGDVSRVLLDHETFSSQVSRHRSVPNGMDPPGHTAYRRAIEPYFSAGRMRRFEPVCRDVASRLLEPLAARALELRVAMEELLRRSRRIELSGDETPRKAVFPANGWESLPLRLS